MSYYEDERRQYRPARERRRDDYDDDSTYDRPRVTTRSSAVVKRRDSYDSADDEVTRDFPPPSGRGGYYRETVVRKSSRPPPRARSYDDDKYFDDRYDDDRTYAAARRGGRDGDRRNRPSRRRSSDYSSSRSRTPPKRERRKSKAGEALEAVGLGGLAATLLGKKSRSRSRDGDRAYSEDRYSSRRRSKSRDNTQEQLKQALKAAVLAGAGEAFRARKEPGGWGGEKGKRVLTAAFSAGGVDGLINKNGEDHGTRNVIGSAIAGIATSRLVNGPQSKSRGGSPDTRGGRSRSRGGRSQSRGGLGDLAAGGVVAAAAKKAYDSFRGQDQNQNRGRQRSRSVSYSDESRSRSRPNRRRSVSRGVAKGLAAVGLNSAAEKVDPDRRSRRYSDEYEDRSGRRGYNDYRDDVGNPRSGPLNGQARSSSQPRSDWQMTQQNVPANYSLDYGPRHTGDPDTDSSSDLGSSTDEEKKAKRGQRKKYLTTGLATIATIHAGHSVYQSYDKREARKRAVREGKISPEQAKENRNKDRLQDAASVGLAALGIKGAYSEWKEMKEGRDEIKEEQETIKRHREKRAARREKYHQLEENGLLHTGHNNNSMPNLHSPQSMAAPPMGSGYFTNPYAPHYESQNAYAAGPPRQAQPMYYDDNPYHTPPVVPTPPNQYPNQYSNPNFNQTRSEPTHGPPPPSETDVNRSIPHANPNPKPDTNKEKDRDLKSGDPKKDKDKDKDKDNKKNKDSGVWIPASAIAIDYIGEVGEALMDNVPTP